ncbi:hypothetical protein [Aquimarina longa]|uniref:hypothetical protein n=1 Tax=Aquimarina longa TaxID=1080221 RepID=UPI0007837FAC|nr:hypothetical protein [Aquimarina longa]
MKSIKKLVVIRGSFAGLELIKRLGNPTDYQIVLVNSNNYNFFPPLIYQRSTSFIKRSAISYPFQKIQQKLKTIHFWLDSIEKIIPEENKIRTLNNWLDYYIYKASYFRMIIQPKEIINKTWI